MNIYRLKIKDKYIPLIREGIKKHEYRLASIDRKEISIGDILVLINNQNKNDFVKVVVKKKEFFSNWDEALEKYGFSDFPGYRSIEEIKQECYRFYTKDKVDENGIEVLHFSPLKKDIKNSNVLLDTNIVIHRESGNNVSYEVMQLYNLLEKLKVNKFLHEDIKDELRKYKDVKTREVMLSKVETYNIISSLEIDDQFFNSVVSKYSSNDNSVVDNKFLYQIYKGKVDYFITDDKTLIQKANDLYLGDVVLSGFDFLKKIEESYPSLIKYSVLSVKLTKIVNINVNDQFFDTLREDYGGIKFNDWLKSKANEEAYVFNNSSGLQGFLYLKLENENENYDDIKPNFSPKRRLKVGTFKINSTGFRVGERFIKIITDYAIKSKTEEIYVTLFENRREEIDLLINLMMKWGFTKWGYKLSTGELVLVKNMNGIYDETKDPKFNYPFHRKNNKFGWLPIESQWHTDLFPDLHLKNEDMSIFEERPCGYAVEKIYVCKQMPKAYNRGDILVIYRMSDRWPATYYSVASGYCIVQDVTNTKTFEEYKALCSNKSVFNDSQLYELFHKQGKNIVVKILYLESLEKKVIYKDLLYNNIVNENEGPRLSTLLTEEQFKKLVLLGKKGSNYVS